jgi:hypothetical protein
MTGTSEIQVNDLGTTELHKQHRVQLEPSDSTFLRGRVVDQIYIDKLLLSKKLSMQQHATAEWFLNQAVKANCYVTTPNFSLGFGGKQNSNYTNHLLAFSRTMRKVSKKFGEKGSRVLFQTVVDNLKIKTTQQMKLFTDILDYLGRQNGKVHTV